jgi:hypothetical protein
MGNADGPLNLENAGSVVTTTTRGAWSAYAYQTNGASAQGSWLSSVSEFYLGFGFNHTGTGGFLYLTSQNGGAGGVNIQLDITAGHAICWRLGFNGTIIDTGTTVLSTNVWYFIELHAVIHDTTGSIEVKINGTSEFNHTNTDTRADAAANGNLVNQIKIGPISAAYYDDLYVNDTSGAQNTGYSGDTRWSAYIPNASGDNTGLTRGGSDSGTNWGQVDERPPNDATDYVFGTGTTVYDLYNIPNTSAVATVQSVTLWLRAQKSDAGAKNIATVIKSGATPTETVGSDVALSTSWTYYNKIYNNEPVDNVAWTAAKLDALQIGAKAR